ncbi:MAG: 50S ribosomal protein L9 [Chloroflexi bacterium]|nr:50S ribosomal protein L9 [Chloroflexota bacterium]
MKVIFLEDVPGTADAGEVKDVKNGFARNYLLPRQLAARATINELQRMNSIQKTAQQNRLKVTQDMTKVAQAMEGMQVAIEAKIGPTGRLFGSVTSRHIAEAINLETGRDLNHRNVLIGDSLHELGDYPVSIRLYRDVVAHVNVSVIPEGGAEAVIDEGATEASVEEDAAPETPEEAPEEEVASELEPSDEESKEE